MTPAWWLRNGAQVALFVYVVACAAALALAEREWVGARIPRAFVTGRAAASSGDSGVFATPVLPRKARLTIPHADAESAAVALGYWDAPGVQDLTALPDYEEIPLERRHFCGRTYYVQPIVSMPDTNVIRHNSENVWGMWAPTWVVPICDERERVRTTVTLSDVPLGTARVIQGERSGDIPRLITTPTSFPHMGLSSSCTSRVGRMVVSATRRWRSRNHRSRRRCHCCTWFLTNGTMCVGRDGRPPTRPALFPDGRGFASWNRSGSSRRGHWRTTAVAASSNSSYTLG